MHTDRRLNYFTNVHDLNLETMRSLERFLPISRY